jgi:hypothetical protein
MFNREKRRKRKLYRSGLNDFKENFEKAMLEPKRLGINPEVPWNSLDFWATAMILEEAQPLSGLTRWLMVLSAILSALTVVLALPIIIGFFAGVRL